MGARQGWSCTPGCPCSRHRAHRAGPRRAHTLTPSPSLTHTGCHSAGELTWEPCFPRQSTQIDATQQLAHRKLLFSQGLSNLQRQAVRSCLKCYETNSFWGTVMPPVPQKAGVGQKKKGREMEVLGGKGHLAPLPLELLHSHRNTGKQLKEESPM